MGKKHQNVQHYDILNHRGIEKKPLLYPYEFILILKYNSYPKNFSTKLTVPFYLNSQPWLFSYLNFLSRSLIVIMFITGLPLGNNSVLNRRIKNQKALPFRSVSVVCHTGSRQSSHSVGKFFLAPFAGSPPALLYSSIIF